MIEEKNTVRKAHNIIIESRKNVSLSGIEDVDGFDEQTVVMFSNMGVITVKGNDLHIIKLSIELGEVLIEGEICSVEYSESSRPEKGFLGKLFK